MDVRAKTKPWGQSNGLQNWETGLGKTKKKISCIESPQEHLASIILNGWSLKQSGLFLDLAKLSNRRRRVLVWEVIKTLMVTLIELHDLIWRWEKLTEGRTSLRHSTDLGLMAKWPNSSFSSVWTHETLIGIHKNTPNNSDYDKKKDSDSGLMNLNSLFMSEGNQAPLITCMIPSQQWSMVAAASRRGGVLQRQGLRKWSEKTESRMQNRDILNENLVQSTSDWAESLPSNKTITLRTQPRQCLRDDSMNVLERSSQSWDLETVRHLWRNLEMAVHRWSPANQTQMCKACCIIPKKIWGWNCCQSVLSFELRVWRLVQWHFFSVSSLIHCKVVINPVFALSVWWVGCRSMWEKSNFIKHNKATK